MSRSDPEQVAELFQRACELQPDEREDFLEAVGRRNPGLRTEVASLLAHDRDEVPEILRAGVLPGHREDGREQTPDRIGPFRVIGRVAEGGMGVVYRAVQEHPIHRSVAIKLIRPGIESRQVIARFETERQALALMHHPNVARVLDAGTTEQGRPYFVMDFVDGEPINTFCDKRNLSIRKRLELFMRVCAGMQHAHQKGIIHRDIKPSNILVAVSGGRPTPIIIDFGIAKALEHPLAGMNLTTQMGQLIGTPEYMSPEQAEMTGHNIDTRTDVYSLGALLYELLVGSPPFDPATLAEKNFDEVRRLVREIDPPSPSARVAMLPDPVRAGAAREIVPALLSRRLRGDLDLIVMKALSKESERRYASPSELAADIRRHLDDEPVLASPPGAWYRLGKLVRKHRVGAAFAASLIVVLVGFAVTMSFQAARIARERDRANQAAMTTERALTLTMDLLDSYEPGQLAGGIVNDLGSLDRILTQIEQLHDQPLMRGQLLITTAKVYRDFGFHDRAIDLLERARFVLRGAAGDDHADTLRATSALAFLYFYRGRFDEAEPLFVESLEAQRRVLGLQHDVTLRTETDLANLYTASGRYSEAEKLHLEALEGLRSTVGEDDRRTLSSMLSLGMLYTASESYEQAESFLTDVADRHRRLLGPEHPNTLRSLTSLAVLYMYQRRFEESQALYEEALAGKDLVLGEEHPSTLKTLYNFACLLTLQDRRAEAIDLLGEAVDRGYSDSRLFTDPDLDPLREEARFVELVDRVRERLE